MGPLPCRLLTVSVLSPPVRLSYLIQNQSKETRWSKSVVNKHVWSLFQHKNQESHADLNVIYSRSGSVVYFHFHMGRTTEIKIWGEGVGKIMGLGFISVFCCCFCFILFFFYKKRTWNFCSKTISFYDNTRYLTYLLPVSVTLLENGPVQSHEGKQQLPQTWSVTETQTDGGSGFRLVGMARGVLLLLATFLTVSAAQFVPPVSSVLLGPR